MAKFLNQDGLRFFAAWVKTFVETETQLNITTAINDQSTNQQIPGALAVFELLTNAIAGIEKVSMEIVTALPATGETNVIYLIEQDAGLYSMNAWINGAWADLGTTEIDLTNYWSKTDLTAMTNTDIQNIIDEVMS